MRIVRRICTVIAVGYCVLLILAFVRGMLQPLLEKQERAEFEAGAMKEIDRFSDALDENWTESGRGTSRVVSMVYVDGEGEELICHICQTNILSGEVPRNEDGLSIVLNEVIDPDTAEASRTCRVNNQEAMLYEKDGRAYPVSYTHLIPGEGPSR